jgi:hypothetical protein
MDYVGGSHSWFGNLMKKMTYLGSLLDSPTNVKVKNDNGKERRQTKRRRKKRQMGHNFKWNQLGQNVEEKKH